jgi:hypothetical protein
MRSGFHRARAGVIGGVVVVMAAASLVAQQRARPRRSLILSAARAVEAGAR